MTMRRRNTILAALERARRLEGVTLNSLVAFLYLCENEGVGVTDVAQLCGLNPATGSRAVRALLEPGARWAMEPSLGLVRMTDATSTRNRKALRLTESGVALRDELDAMLGSPVRILQG